MKFAFSYFTETDSNPIQTKLDSENTTCAITLNYCTYTIDTIEDLHTQILRVHAAYGWIWSNFQKIEVSQLWMLDYDFTLKFFVDLSPVWQPATILVSVSLNINVRTELFFTSVCCVFTRNLYSWKHLGLIRKAWKRWNIM